MSRTLLTGTILRSGSIPTSALGGGVVSSSAQIITALPAGTVSSSAQVQLNNISGSTLILSSAPPSESVVFVKALLNTGAGATGSFSGSLGGTVAFTQLPNITIVADNHLFIGDGTTDIYTLSQSYNPEILTVSTDGLVNALSADYIISGTQLMFVSAPPSSSNILIKAIRLSLT